jgi:hypothetical protein
MVDVIERGEPAMMLAHWTGFYWNGEEKGFAVFKEVVRRLKARYDHLIWMKLSELARYWAAKELTRIDAEPDTAAFRLRAPYACPSFTLRLPAVPAPRPNRQTTDQPPVYLQEIRRRLDLRPGTWIKDNDAVWVCFDLTQGESRLALT